MVATAKKSKGLTVKQVDARTWQVECLSKQHGFFHVVVKSLSSGRLICDSACHAYRRTERCPHTLEVAILLNGGRPIVAHTPFELWDGDEITPEPAKPDCCACTRNSYWGKLKGCTCQCHPAHEPEQPKPKLEDCFRDA